MHALCVAIEDRPQHLGIETIGKLGQVRQSRYDDRHRLSSRAACCTRRHGRVTRRNARRGFQLGVLTQNRALELLELLARVDSELLHERAASVLVGGERVRLPAER